MTEAKTEAKPKAAKDDAPGTHEESLPPEQPDIALDTTNEDTNVGVVHRRHDAVAVPEYDDLTQVETIESDPVDYFQVASSPRGAVFSFNGAAYALDAGQVAALKVAVDRVIAGLTL